jgi:transposase
MPRPQRQFSKEQIDEISNALKKCTNANEKLRLIIVNIRATTKLNAKQIAEMVNRSVSSVEHIIGIYFRNGLEGLIAKKREGNRRNLSHTQEKELLASFEEKAKNGHMLTISEIQEEYCKYVEHKVAVSTIYRMLARHGWRKIMPRSKHPKKASDQAIEAYKKNQ